MHNPVGIHLSRSSAIPLPTLLYLSRLKFNNRGSAPIDVERPASATIIAGGMVSLELQSSGGVLLARTGLTQLAGGVAAAMTDSTEPGDGPVAKELTYYASIPAGSSFMFAPVVLPIPDAFYGTLLLSARVSRPVFDISSVALAGQGVFQTLSSEPAVSAAPYSVSVAPAQPVYDQDRPVILSGQARDSAGALLPGASVQVELTGRGYTRTFQAVTDNTGSYSIVFTPMSQEAGSYVSRLV